MSTAGYSGTPLIRKLGIKEGFTITTVDAPNDYFDLLGPLPEDVTVLDLESEEAFDFIHVFARDSSDLEPLGELRGRIQQDGMIWVSWPKKSSGVETDLSGNVVREAGLESGLVDIKVCAVDETWSGLKFVIRVEDRG